MQRGAYWGIGTGSIGRQGDPKEEQTPNVGHIICICLVTNLPVDCEDEERRQGLFTQSGACINAK